MWDMHLKILKLNNYMCVLYLYIVYDVNGVDVKLLPSKLNKAQQEIFDVLNMELPKTL